MNNLPAQVHALGKANVPGIVGALCESFHDYPVMLYVLGADRDHYAQRLETLIGLFVMAPFLCGETVFGIGEPDTLDAAAIVSRPGGPPCPPELGALRERVWTALGAVARSRYEAYNEICATFQVEAPHIHINMIGVRPRAQRRGLGRRLIEHVHGLSREDPASQGVTLTTEDPVNLPFYERLGYRITGHAEIAPGLETWGFFREV
jgi:GNAT superfamily N-acetyltransferase